MSLHFSPRSGHLRVRQAGSILAGAFGSDEDGGVGMCESGKRVCIVLVLLEGEPPPILDHPSGVARVLPDLPGRGLTSRRQSSTTASQVLPPGVVFGDRVLAWSLAGCLGEEVLSGVFLQWACVPGGFRWRCDAGVGRWAHSRCLVSFPFA